MMCAAARKGLDLVVRPAWVEASLWRRFRFEAEADCREVLFNRYAGLARVLAARQLTRSAMPCNEKPELEHFAYEGLLQAIDRFDPMRGRPFGAYARRRIIGCIADGIARLTEIGAQLRARRRAEQERLRSLADAEKREREDALGLLSELAVGLALGIILEGTSLFGGEDHPDPSPSAYERLAWREMQARLAGEIDRLPAKEAAIVRQHYGHGLSFAQIARLMELSASRISQLHSSALARLRRRIGAFT